ncbi:MAG TPA: hypothetical protein VNI54_12765 [Thermoanaerobaculia bacterium]|nr:hypothetical protein [Thermoanaerobaculia bacterium]
MNRDPITGEPGSHPVGTGVGSAGAAAVGAALGAPFGPIGMLVGGAIGAVAGGAAGHAVGERIDPTGEAEYWKSNYSTRPYHDKTHNWDDYEPAYRYGWESRTAHRDRKFDDVENDLQSGWETAKGKSRMTWERAKDAVRDSWDRTDRTYSTYRANDDKFRTHFTKASYNDKSHDFDRDFAPAYRYGTFSRERYSDRTWDDNLERDLSRDWDRTKGASRLTWDKAKFAAKDAWHGVERALPGDADKDGR